MPNHSVDRFPKRKHPRLRNYDYTQPNHYFVTICTHQKALIFGDPLTLSVCGQVAYDGFEEIEKHFAGISVDKYVVMPNHVHAIIQVEQAGTDLSVIVGQYKSFVTRRIRRSLPNAVVWQTSFHDHVIRNQQDYLRIWNYIDTNPARWQEDCFFTE